MTRPASLRRSAPFATLLLALVVHHPAAAGDAAARDVLGFSPDGKLFAFEQFAQFYDATEVLDEIVVIDTTTDRFVKGTPLRIETKAGDKRDIADVRAQLTAKAKPLLDRLKIGAAGRVVAGQPSMQLDELDIYQTATEPLAKAQTFPLPDGRKLSLSLADKPLGQVPCKTARGIDIDIASAGLALQLSIDDAPPVQLATDASLPKSRRCVAGYGIAEVLHHQAKDGAQTLAVLLEMVDHADFHAGPNRRFMAVTTRLPGK